MLREFFFHTNDEYSVAIMINARHSSCNVEADCLYTCIYIYIYILFIQSASTFHAIVYSGLFYGTNEQW
jgi:hypothetical protein